jgi:hypothetical protein
VSLRHHEQQSSRRRPNQPSRSNQRRHENAAKRQKEQCRRATTRAWRLLLPDIGSHAAAGDDTRANMNAGASSSGTSDVLFARCETIASFAREFRHSPNDATVARGAAVWASWLLGERSTAIPRAPVDAAGEKRNGQRVEADALRSSFSDERSSELGGELNAELTATAPLGLGEHPVQLGPSDEQLAQAGPCGVQLTA